MRHLYLSELRDFINNCGIPKEELKQFRIATSKADDAIPKDMKHTLTSLEKSKNVYVYISRYMGKSPIGIRLYPKDMYVIHNDCPLEEVFAGCSEMNNVDALWFWKYMANDTDTSGGDMNYQEYPKEFLEKLLEPTAATVKDIVEQKMLRGVTSNKAKQEKKETKKKETAKIKKTSRSMKKANIVNITLDEIEKDRKRSTKPSDSSHDGALRSVLRLDYDDSKYPAELVEQYLEFYGLNPVDLANEHGINAIIKTMYDNQGSKESMEIAVGLYDILAAHSNLTNIYNQLLEQYNSCKTSYDLIASTHDAMSKKLYDILNKYCGYVAYYKKRRCNMIGKFGFDAYTVEIFKVDDKVRKTPVKQYTVYNKKNLSIGSILDNTGLYVSSVIKK